VLVACLTLLSACLSLILYRHTLVYGFDYDDYHFVRPYASKEVLATFHGPWDASGIEVPFYRPLTIAFYALRFEALGLNAVAHHQLTLALFVIAATLAGWIAFRWSTSATAGILTMIFFTVHPAMPYSLVGWVTNQMHLIETLAVFVALLWWDLIRHQGAIWWTPLLLLAAVAFAIKEDGVMLLPAIVCLHTARRWIAEPDLPRIPAGFLIAAAALLVGLVGWRGHSLHGLGGYRRPGPQTMWLNLVKGWNGVFRLAPAHRPWQPVASWCSMVLLIATPLLWRRAPAGVRFCAASGALVALLFDAPFALVSKAEQMHLVAAGAALMLGAGGAALIRAASAVAARGALITLVLASAVPFGIVARDISYDFDPFGPIVLAHDAIVREWAAVPDEIRAYLARKREPRGPARISTNPAEAIDYVSFGVHGLETDPSGVPYHWMSRPRADILINARVRRVDIPLRHAIEAFRDPARVRIGLDGRPVDDLVLDTPRWRTTTLSLRRDDVPRFSGMHRLQISIDRTWRPSEIFSGSQDTRVLGVQVGVLTAR
jgi:hypothetical protein